MAQGKQPTTKADVLLAFANLIVRLGKNDLKGVRRQLDFAREQFEQWTIDRPEREAEQDDEKPPKLPNEFRR